MRSVINTLNEFAKENSFLSLIALAIIGNLATDIFKKISLYLIINLAKRTDKWSVKKVNILIDLYEKEIERVEKIKNKDPNELSMLVENLYDKYYFYAFNHYCV